MALLITYNEQQTIKPIASNSQIRFAQIMEETQINELQDLLGFQLYQDLIKNPTDSKYATLLNGVDWTYNDQVIHMSGLKYVLAHYFFANYTRENQYKDTFSGHVSHNIPESNRVNDIEKNRIEKRARETAYKFWREVKLYLDNNGNTYAYWNRSSDSKVFRPKMKRLTQVQTNSYYDNNIFSKRHITGS